jgi:DsbC/DsbD-like thiol-disulfide interchange protein
MARGAELQHVIFSIYRLISLALAAVISGYAVGETLNATSWAEVLNARVRMMGGAVLTADAKSSPLAGVEIVLADGWKTYWRFPGDSGVPPVFHWSGSLNLASVKVLYPAPSRLTDAGGDVIGYRHQVIFPVELSPLDAKKPIELKLTIEFGICKDICIPAEANMALTIPPSAAGASDALVAALDRVPRAPDRRRAGDPELKRVFAKLDAPRPRLIVEALFPRGAADADVFIEAPDGLFVALPKRSNTSVAGVANFEVDLTRSSDLQDLMGKELRVTLVCDIGAAEAFWTLK